MVQSRSIRSTFFLAVVLATSLAARPSAAQSASDEGEQRTVDDLLRSGVALRIEGRDEAALQAFSLARSRCGCSEALAQAALAELALGQWIAAEEHLTVALREGGAWIDAARGELVAELRRIDAHLGWIEVIAAPPAARVTIDGREAPLGADQRTRARVEPGRVRVNIAASGFVATERTATVTEGSTVRLSVTLAPEPPRRPALAAIQPSRTATTSALRPAEIAAIGAAGALSIAGIVGLALGQQRWSVYNDDSQCLLAGRTREENCGAQRRDGEVATVVGAASLTAAAAATTVLIAQRILHRPVERPSLRVTLSIDGARSSTVQLVTVF